MRIQKLDSLRGIFSLMIVYHHYDPRIIPKILADNFIKHESYIFVDFFFVLSGFVISLNYNKINTKNNLFFFLKKGLSEFIHYYYLRH